MKLRLLWVGKTKNGPIRELVDDYLERIKHFSRIEVSEVREADATRDGKQVKESEGERILAALKSDPFVVLLDERGKELKSEELAKFISEHMGRGTKQLSFVIGGFEGSSEAVKARADSVLALSRMTLTHEMARALLAEQIYRAFTIIHNLPYQK